LITKNIEVWSMVGKIYSREPSGKWALLRLLVIPEIVETDWSS
jgi:hypothetical protein